jgi:hypothetical protein
MVDLLAEWTEEELKSALEEALTLLRCQTRMGGIFAARDDAHSLKTCPQNSSNSIVPEIHTPFKTTSSHPR